MSPEKAPNLGKDKPTAAERRRVLRGRMIEHTLDWYSQFNRAAKIGFLEESRPDMAPYAKLVGPARVFKFERVRSADKPFLQKVMALGVLSMPNSFPSGLNADELVAEVKKLAGKELSKAERLNPDRSGWPNIWHDAANVISDIDRAVESQQQHSS